LIGQFEESYCHIISSVGIYIIILSVCPSPSGHSNNNVLHSKSPSKGERFHSLILDSEIIELVDEDGGADIERKD
jgi:hypothetical protein